MSETDKLPTRDCYLLALTGLSFHEIADTTGLTVDEVRLVVENAVARNTEGQKFDSLDDALDYLRLARIQRSLWAAALRGGVNEARQLINVIEQRAALKRPSHELDDDQEPPESSDSISRALPNGRLETLKTLRDHLARSIDNCRSMRDLAALSLRLQTVLDQIDEIEGGSSQPSGSPADEIAARRRARELERGA